jgi:hypothetical protein
LERSSEGGEKIKIYFLTICSLSKIGELKYLTGQNKNKNLFILCCVNAMQVGEFLASSETDNCISYKCAIFAIFWQTAEF